MGNMIGPLIFVIVLISVLAFRASKSVTVLREADGGQAVGEEKKVPEIVEEHPYAMNPIIWVYLIALIFILLVIFYYAASSSNY